MVGDPNSKSYASQDAMVKRFFNTDAFVRAPQFTFGNAGTGTIEGPGLALFDLSLQKDFRFNERVAAQFRFDLFNAFNHTNFGLPDTTFGSANFGRITSAREARDLQFAFRLQF
jgi:hypothetical protein